MKLPPKMPQRAMVRIWGASLHQKASTYASALRFLFCNKAKLIERVDSNSCGAVAEDSVKTAQWAVFSSAARAIHPCLPKNRNVSKYAAVLFYDTLPCCFCFTRLSEQLGKNTVLHNKSGGGQGEDAAIKGGVPGADAVLHKGQLCGGKLLAVQGFVGIKVKPLAQPQL